MPCQIKLPRPAAKTAREKVSALGGCAALLAVACVGCTVLSYTSPQGEHFTRSAFGTSTAFASLTLETGSNGLRRVQLEGYRNDAAQALGAVTEAAVRAAIAGGR